jgi:hypothetical protein
MRNLATLAGALRAGGAPDRDLVEFALHVAETNRESLASSDEQFYSLLKFGEDGGDVKARSYCVVSIKRHSVLMLAEIAYGDDINRCGRVT